MPPQGRGQGPGPAPSSLLEDLKRLRAAGGAPQPDGQGQAQESAPPEGMSQAAWLKQMIDDLGIGIGKGAGETAVNLGNLVHHTPIVGSITDAIAKAVGPEGTDPEAAFSHSTDEMGLGADNTTQKVGKFAEQLLELMTTAGPVRKAAVEAGVRMIPNASSPSTMGLLNKVAALVGRPVGEGVNFGANALLHNDETPGRGAMIAAAGPVVGEGAAVLAPLMKNPNIQRLLALIAGITGAHAMGGVTSDLGIGAGLGAYGLSRLEATHAMRSPTAVKTLQRISRRGIPAVTRTIATADSQARRER